MAHHITHNTQNFHNNEAMEQVEGDHANAISFREIFFNSDYHPTMRVPPTPVLGAHEQPYISADLQRKWLLENYHDDYYHDDDFSYQYSQIDCLDLGGPEDEAKLFAAGGIFIYGLLKVVLLTAWFVFLDFMLLTSPSNTKTYFFFVFAAAVYTTLMLFFTICTIEVDNDKTAKEAAAVAFELTTLAMVLLFAVAGLFGAVSINYGWHQGPVLAEWLEWIFV